MPVLRSFSVQHGVIAAERLPTESEQLYATPEELGAAFGVKVSEAQVRFAMALIHAFTNRPSLWPVEYELPSIRMPQDRYESRIPITPVLQIVEAAGRYAYGWRRDRQGISALSYGYGAILALQGVAPRLVPINVDLIQVNAATGIFSLPFGTFLLPFNEIVLRVICGYIEIPGRVKAALAEICNSVAQRGVSDRIAYSVGRISRRYAPGSHTFISPQAEQLLQPFVVQTLL